MGGAAAATGDAARSWVVHAGRRFSVLPPELLAPAGVHVPRLGAPSRRGRRRQRCRSTSASAAQGCRPAGAEQRRRADCCRCMSDGLSSEQGVPRRMAAAVRVRRWCCFVVGPKRMASRDCRMGRGRLGAARRLRDMLRPLIRRWGGRSEANCEVVRALGRSSRPERGQLRERDLSWAMPQRQPLAAWLKLGALGTRAAAPARCRPRASDFPGRPICLQRSSIQLAASDFDRSSPPERTGHRSFIWATR
jgi:hypothetical protein